MPMTFLQKQYRRLERTGYPRGHTIRVWRQAGGWWYAVADQVGGIDLDNDTPEGAIKNAVDNACDIDRRCRARR